MKFGKVDNPEFIDFTLPEDAVENLERPPVSSGLPSIYIGCAKWNRQDLKGFYPRGTKDELTYYSQQFNSIELNATFYRNYGEKHISKWRDKTTPDFKFFPKIHQYISHIKRLNEGIEESVQEYCENIAHFGDKLGMCFLQLHNNFAPKNIDRLSYFLELFPSTIPLAVEVRHTDWHADKSISQDLYALLEAHQRTNVLVDTAGRRDLLHMRHTSDSAFVRYVGANHPTDYDRLDAWVDRLEDWSKQGIKNINFFIHQNIEEASPLLSAYFIKKLNARLGTDLIIPQTSSSKENKQQSLF